MSIRNIDLDMPSQVEFNRRKNIEQDGKLDTLISQVNDLITQVPGGFLPRSYYGLVSGNNTYNKDNIFSYNWIGLTQLTVKCLFIEIRNNKKVIKWECTGDIGINFFRAYYLYRIT